MLPHSLMKLANARLFLHFQDHTDQIGYAEACCPRHVLAQPPGLLTVLAVVTQLQIRAAPIFTHALWSGTPLLNASPLPHYHITVDLLRSPIRTKMFRPQSTQPLTRMSPHIRHAVCSQGRGVLRSADLYLARHEFQITYVSHQIGRELSLECIAMKNCCEGSMQLRAQTDGK